MPRAVRQGARFTWDYATKAAAEKNAKDMKKHGAKEVKIDKRKDKLGRTFYRLSAKV